MKARGFQKACASAQAFLPVFIPFQLTWKTNGNPEDPDAKPFLQPLSDLLPNT
jgi:hypothetical protein